MSAREQRIQQTPGMMNVAQQNRGPSFLKFCKAWLHLAFVGFAIKTRGLTRWHRGQIYGRVSILLYGCNATFQAQWISARLKVAYGYFRKGGACMGHTIWFRQIFIYHWHRMRWNGDDSTARQIKDCDMLDLRVMISRNDEYPLSFPPVMVLA
jgi:hypothetical protein